MLEQFEWEKLNLIVSKMNGIKNVTKMRREFLLALDALVVFDLADFYLSDVKETGKVRLLDPVVISKYSKTFDEEFMIKYEKYFEQVDYVKWIFSSSESIVYRESDLINNEIRVKSPFYLKYLKPSGLVNVAGISICEKGVCMGAITLYRTEKRGDFSDKDIYILKQFLPHLQNKLSMEYEEIQCNFKNYGSEYYLLAHEYNLSKREIEIIKLICKGKNNMEISGILSISVNTVKKHISNIFAKMGVDSRTQLINFFIKNDKELFEEK